jgi:LysM repeat protein
MTNREFLIKYVGFRKEAAEPYRKHVIQPGDNYHKLGKRYNVTAGAIAGSNPGLDPRRLQQGSTINIPNAIPKEPELPPFKPQPAWNGGYPSVTGLPDFNFSNINRNVKFSPTPEEQALLNSIGHAEHGSNFNPNDLFNPKVSIRTKYQPMKRNKNGTLYINPKTGKPVPLGSTASFWGQLTRGLADDMFKRYPKEMAPYKEYYYGVLQPMFARQSYFGKESGRKHLDPNNYHSWQYGAAGVPHFKGDHQLNEFVPYMQSNYSGMVGTTQRMLINELKKKGLKGKALLDAYIRRYRGDNDSRYTNAVYSYMRKNHPEQANYWGIK